MIRRMVFGLGLITSVALAGAAGAAETTVTAGATGTAQVAKTTDAQQAPDLTGTWKFEPKRSDSMQRPEGGPMERGSRGGMGGAVRMGGAGGMGGGGRGPGGPGGDAERGPRGGGSGGPGGDAERGPRGGDAERGPRGGGPGGPDGAARPARLPDLMHVTMTATLVSFEDSTGKVLQEITTLAGAADQQAHAPGAQVLSGEWKSGKLEIQRPGRGEMKMTETITLEEKGALLVIRTSMPAFGDRPARERKRVYRRVDG